MLLLDAVGFSGGEPALQPTPVTEIFRWAKKTELKTFLNTNGINPNLLDKLIQEKLVDYVAISVIAPLKAEDYERIANIKEGRKAVEKVKQSIDLCLRSKIPLEIRTTIVPTLIDDEKSIREIARSVKNCYTYVLQAFDPSGDILNKRFKEVPSPKRDLLVKLAKAAFEEGLREVRIRTRDRGEEIIARRNV
jgi:pyruvate formate lyase activating enzyme